MPTTIRLLILLATSSFASSDTAQESISKRSDSYAYGNGFSHDMPVAFAAVSLHSPMPVLHIVSNNPLPMTHQAVASTLSQTYGHPYPVAPPPSRYPEPVPADTVLYARPDSYGGYTYFRKTRHTPRKVKKNQPVLLRIHKYRVVRDR